MCLLFFTLWFISCACFPVLSAYVSLQVCLSFTLSVCDSLFRSDLSTSPVECRRLGEHSEKNIATSVMFLMSYISPCRRGRMTPPWQILTGFFWACILCRTFWSTQYCLRHGKLLSVLTSCRLLQDTKNSFLVRLGLLAYADIFQMWRFSHLYLPFVVIIPDYTTKHGTRISYYMYTKLLLINFTLNLKLEPSLQCCVGWTNSQILPSCILLA